MGPSHGRMGSDGSVMGHWMGKQHVVELEDLDCTDHLLDQQQQLVEELLEHG